MIELIFILFEANDADDWGASSDHGNVGDPGVDPFESCCGDAEDPTALVPWDWELVED